MFLDQAKLHVLSGAGGNGMVAWRREKYVAFGGPAGGDGGEGGNVVIEATADLNTLLDFKYQSIFKAEDGEKGRSKNMHGRKGRDLVIKVPCGTIVRDSDTKQAIADLTNPGDRVIVASGGRGGRGNARFVSSKRQAPQFCEPGEPGIERHLDLELKLIADIGIIGMPNAGKSTFISVISAAKPKIADYPFTTLTPNLGVLKKPNGDGIVLADIPGLIEGASAGLGLGHDFLRHVERTRLLLHLVDIASVSEFSTDSSGQRNPVQDWKMINHELMQYKDILANKPQLLVLTKIDALTPEELTHWVEAFQAECMETGRQTVIYPISAVSRLGMTELTAAILEFIEAHPEVAPTVEVVKDTKAFDHDDSAFEIRRKGKLFYVTGGKVERLFSVTDMRNRAAVFRLMNILRAMGVFGALAKAGAQEGHTVCIAGHDFDYVPDDRADEREDYNPEFDYDSEDFDDDDFDDESAQEGLGPDTSGLIYHDKS